MSTDNNGGPRPARLSEPSTHPLTVDGDVVVVGSGVAGLSAALAAANAGATVHLLTAGPLLAGSSPHAQGGIAAALAPGDAPTLHAADTLAVGAGLNDRRAVTVLVEEGRTAVRQLLRDGVPFDYDRGVPALGLEAGHHRHRIVHAAGSATGRILTSALNARVITHPRISVHIDTPAESFVAESGRVTGVRGNGCTYRGRGVVLATGGYAGLWGRTTNAPENRGSGLALAWEAGASLADLEFVQFHPTALSLPGRPAFLLSEALRGEGALVVDAAGRAIMDPLLPRDRLARAIAKHLRHDGQVYLSLRHLDAVAVRGRFANIAQQLDEWGLDLARDLLPVAPAAHYCMGGIRTDDEGRSDVPGLYAAGEVACTGVQGANRLASNSLLECLVFGARAALAVLSDSEQRTSHWAVRALPSACDVPRGQHAMNDAAELGRRLDRDLGVERDASGLGQLLTALPEPADSGTSQGVLAATLAARAALIRCESRGAHFRTELPESAERWRGHILWRRGSAPQFEEVAT